jgi:hypothetical protein
MNDPISMWSGPDVVRAAAELVDAVNGHDVRADALDARAHLGEHPREVLHVGLARHVAHHRRAGRERGGHERVFGRHDRGLVHEHLAGS